MYLQQNLLEGIAYLSPKTNAQWLWLFELDILDIYSIFKDNPPPHAPYINWPDKELRYAL